LLNLLVDDFGLQICGDLLLARRTRPQKMVDIMPDLGPALISVPLLPIA
jgi:hypothetical protein